MICFSLNILLLIQYQVICAIDFKYLLLLISSEDILQQHLTTIV